MNNLKKPFLTGSFYFVCLMIPAKTQAVGVSEVLDVLKLISNQATEIQRLTELVEASDKQMGLIKDLNRGIERTIEQIQSIESVVERVQGLDPVGVRSVAALNRRISETKGLLSDAFEILRLKEALIDSTIEQASLQSESAYLMGQEMTKVGSSLAAESRTASPGRASQISASASSAQMLAQGMQLQAVSHLIQLQAQSLDLQKTLANQTLRAREMDRSAAGSFLKDSRPEAFRRRRLN